ncbi:hypothetical protein GGR57DRAFT_389579 [Xylariaceae sp. FL1272]|nr:hypothetical protein GGR57DRAFT_389579 [Xylariaceae sp. FL1272]
MNTYSLRKRHTDANETAGHHVTKRQRTDGRQQRDLSSDTESLRLVRLDHVRYSVGWICALHIEMAAAIAMLDTVHERLAQDPTDSNTYALGSIGHHNVVIASLPTAGYGTNNAATVASNMSRSFPAIRVRLMVGIGGGIPRQGESSVRLGDIVVSNSVVQFDLGKILANGRFHRTGVPRRPPFALMTAVSRLRADHETRPSKIPLFLEEMHARHHKMTKYSHPGLDQDRLFESDYNHEEGDVSSCKQCDISRLVKDWPLRESTDPVIHYGDIASGNQVMKSAAERDRLAQTLGVMCFEMEAAGLMDNFPCLVIRGISDYSDSHKNKKWQQYAAASAAAYAKELLYVIPGNDIQLPAKSSGICRINDIIPDNIVERDAKELRRQELFESLGFEELRRRQDNIGNAYGRTCGWLLEHPDYQEWQNPDSAAEHHGFLWINGKPGAGKSTLMKFLYNKAMRLRLSNSSTIAFFFNARGSGLEKTSLGMYRSLLFQLLSSFEDLQRVLDDFENHLGRRHVSTDWSIEVVQGLFSKAVLQLGSRRVTCFIDALDECAETDVQSMIYYFEHLGQIALEKSIRLLICFSSRHYPYISILYGRRLVLENQAGHEDDLQLYVHEAFKRFGTNNLVNEMQSEVLRKAAGVFMWVVLVMEILSKEFQKGRLFAMKRRLQEIPDKLSDLFRDILTRDNDNMDDLLLCIQWILFSERPLTCEEYYFALVSGLTTDSDDIGRWHRDDTSADAIRRYVSSSSKGLAEVTKGRGGIAGIVQFIHESVRDFLIKDHGLRELFPDVSGSFQDASHDKLKDCCSQYMQRYVSANPSLRNILIQDVTMKKSKRRFRKATKRYPFLDYATTNVLYHAEAAANGISQQRFLSEFALADWIDLLNLLQIYGVRRYTNNASLMYLLAERGFQNLIWTCRAANHPIDVEGERHRYPFFAAIHNKHHGALEALLKRSLNDPEVGTACAQITYGKITADEAEQGPLFWSLENQYWSMAELILAIEAQNCFPADGYPSQRTLSLDEQSTSQPDIFLRLLQVAQKNGVRFEPNAARVLLMASSKGYDIKIDTV